MPFMWLIIMSLPIAALAGSSRRDTSARFRYRDTNISFSTRDAARTFTLIDKYQGQDFLNEWDFFTSDDPTHGLVKFQSRDDATKKGLAFVQDDGTTVLAVDDKTPLQPGANRESVRISSKKTYNQGLFIADFWSMPHGCSVWPAWWSVGPNWPSAGEIDVIEGTHNAVSNQMTLHTSSGCSLSSRNPGGNLFATKILTTQCATINGDNTGCAFIDTDTRSYGEGFNRIAGGVYAHLWDSSGIKIWYFPRTEIPQDIANGKPNPSSWGTPASFFSSDSCDVNQHFHDHSLVIDTTLCGDLGAATYPNSGCPGTCAEAVADPSNFKYAKWKINYIAVYN